eukprot:Partr_v1_DN28292_c2_g1_i1_m75973 putative DNA repair protein
MKRKSTEESIKPSFVDYDLSRITDTKGGFILEKPSSTAGAAPFKQENGKRRVVYEHLEGEHRCTDCDAPVINTQYLSVYSVSICNQCINGLPDKYSLLTKTECRSDYLLTDEELESLPYMERTNPLKSTYSRMKLFLRSRVEEFALQKWKSWEELDAEFERRCAVKQEAKEKKYKKQVNELRRRTMTANLPKVSIQVEHTHTFVDHGHSQKCSECGLQVDVEEF